MIERIGIPFAPALERGRPAETVIEWWLKARGHLVLPAHAYNGTPERHEADRVPRLRALDHRLSLKVPDYLIATRTGSLWVEVKYKEAGADHGDVGMNLPMHEDYLLVKRETRIPVWVLFCLVPENEIIGLEIDELDRVKRVPNRSLVFYARASFPAKPLAKWSEVLASFQAARGLS